MGRLRRVADIVSALRPTCPCVELEAPEYTSPTEPVGRHGNVMMAVSSMSEHMTDEGWQLAQALQYAGYELAGHGIGEGLTDVGAIMATVQPTIAVIQDKREWDFPPGNFRDQGARFTNVERMRNYHSFNVTVLKDAHQKPQYHMESAAEIGCHAWITYYHPDIVKHLAPYVRKQHLVRTYHSIDARRVPEFTSTRTIVDMCLVSGAVSNAYPLRRMIINNAAKITGCHVLPHPGYHRKGTDTYKYMEELTKYKVAICTSSMYGYTLRKIIEATACGCAVITDLPYDDYMPAIEGNLHRVPTDVTMEELDSLVKDLYLSWDAERQHYLSEEAKAYYDYRVQGCRLAWSLEELRRSYK